MNQYSQLRNLAPRTRTLKTVTTAHLAKETSFDSMSPQLGESLGGCASG